jgi:Spy/CpxP family protein refolding chaperone
MKKALTTIFCIALALCFMTSASFAAAKREKFGSDPRHEMAKRVKFKTSR